MKRFVLRHGGRGRRPCDLKRKATEAQENLISHRERTRRFTNEHVRAEALVNNSLGALEHAVKDAAAATHSDMRIAGP